ncbi:MAG: signal transduction histidine kinase/ActR/RegA family two-component response regulator [Granulosicoccus sp.]|jgi:signal transduction histidine kinase/ActR/RegA family two-component response regulator
MIDIEIQEESLLKSAKIAAESLRRRALESAITLDRFAGDTPDPATGPAKELLRRAVDDAGMLVTEATRAAKELLALAAELAANHKDSLMIKAISDAEEAEASFVKAAEIVEFQKEILLMKANIAAEALQSKAVDDAIDLVDLAGSIPRATHGVPKTLLDNATENAKSLLKEASEDAESLLATAAETAKSLLSRDKQIEEELLRLRKLASVAILAGGIAHDFNNILTGVFGNLEMAKRKLPPDHAAYRYIQTANKSMDRATSLTTQLLTFAKGGEPLFETIDIKPIINDSIMFSLSESSVKTTTTIQQDLWMLTADKGQISQAVTNLIMNADQAMPAGGTLTIEAMNIDDFADGGKLRFSGEFVCFKISDDGVGISEEQLKNIFDPYFTTKQFGSGLGLATTHSIIAKHNGHISVKSELGKGTTFSIYLPAKSDAKTQNKVLLNNTINTIAYPVKLLLMDDDEAVLDISSSMLETLGYSVETSFNGKQALEKYIEANNRGKPFDIVILDLTIPGGMGGEEAMKALLDINPQVKAIVSSGYSTSKVLSNFTEYGFKGRLVKPFRMKNLETEILKILN